MIFDYSLLNYKYLTANFIGQEKRLKNNDNKKNKKKYYALIRQAGNSFSKFVIKYQQEHKGMW